jgi:hemerythrin-like domain-containing protein
MSHDLESSRRGFVQIAGVTSLIVAGGLWTPGWAAAKKKTTGASKKSKESEEAVTPPEDLMREHGVLDRVLLIYEEAMRKFDAKEDFDPAVITQSAQIVRDFIENYHEQSEEQHVFPRFKKAGKMVDLVDVLLAQHQAGRRLTATILQVAPASARGGEERHRLTGAMQAFIHMYRPHAAREDTDLFPKLRGLVSSNEYDSMAEQFEKEEQRRFGEDGFEKTVDRVAQIEQTIGIQDLSKFTPH